MLDWLVMKSEIDFCYIIVCITVHHCIYNCTSLRVQLYIIVYTTVHHCMYNCTSLYIQLYIIAYTTTSLHIQLYIIAYTTVHHCMYNCTSLHVQLYMYTTGRYYTSYFFFKEKNPTNFVMTRFLRLFQNQQFDYFLILLQVSDVYIEYWQFGRSRQTLSLVLQ